MKVLVVNAGSSSLKAQLMETETGEVFAKAYCQRIGINGSFMEYKNPEKIKVEADMPTHKEAFQLFLNYLTSKETGAEKFWFLAHHALNHYAILSFRNLPGMQQEQ